MLSYQVGLEIVLPVADVRAVVNIALPALNMTVLFVLVAHIVSLSLERLSVFAAFEGTSKRSNILCRWVSSERAEMEQMGLPWMCLVQSDGF